MATSHNSIFVKENKHKGMLIHISPFLHYSLLLALAETLAGHCLPACQTKYAVSLPYSLAPELLSLIITHIVSNILKPSKKCLLRSRPLHLVVDEHPPIHHSGNYTNVNATLAILETSSPWYPHPLLSLRHAKTRRRLLGTLSSPQSIMKRLGGVQAS